MYEHDDQTNTRINSLYLGRDRVPSRTFYRAGGEAIPFDGIIGVDGLPTRLQDGRILHEAKGRERKGKERWLDRMTKYPITVGWVSALFLLGVILQGWH